MRSSIKNLSLTLLTLGSFALQAGTQRLPGDNVDQQSRYRGTSLNDLLKLEYDRPDDPALKAELARLYWCSGSKGLAFEHWKWLDSRSPSTQGSWNWSEILQIARSHAKLSTLNTLLVCSTAFKGTHP